MTKIEICKDVITQINTHNLKLDYYGYCKLPEEEHTTFDYECKTCALGGMFLSAFPVLDIQSYPKNSIDSSDIGIPKLGDKFREDLKKYFSEEELLVIEAVYEQDTSHIVDYTQDFDSDVIDKLLDSEYDDGECDIYIPSDYLHRCMEVVVGAANKSERLKIIMQNIIDNGTFKP
jgi:hypothetical protein